jgi:hypothetical protein
MLGAVSASANVTRIPARCSTRPAVRLCAIHAHVRHVNTVRLRIGKQPIRYQWQPERYPARRDRYLTYWTRLDRHAEHTLRAYLATPPWLQEPFYSQAMCIHSKESIDWHEPGSPGGGMQFMQGTWDRYVVRGYEFAATPSAASPDDQLHAAYRLVTYDGDWHEWSTHSLCGL